MEHLNIAFYSDTYLPAVDGVVNSMLNFRRELEKRGHEVYLFVSGDSAAIKKYSNSHVFVSPGTKLRSYPQYKVAFFPYNAVIKLKALKIDLIHAQTPFVMGFSGLLAAKLAKYPIAGSFHTLINDKHVIDNYYPKNKRLKKFTSKYLWKYAMFFYRKCNATIAPSSVIKQMLAKYKVPNVFVVPNGIDTNVFSPRIGMGSFAESIKARDEKIVLYVGRISKEKNIDVLLKAATKIPKDEKIKFVIGGTGPALDYYVKLSKKLKLNNVTFIGFVKQKDLPHLYAASDAVCLPSTFETQGIVALEAMASGKPVIGANSLALKELIKNGKNGEKFEPGNYTACAKKIEKVLNAPASYKKGAIETAKAFSIEKSTDKLIDVYKLILSNNSKAIY